MRLLHRGLFTLSKNGSGCESVPEQVLEKRFAASGRSVRPFGLDGCRLGGAVTP